MKRLIAVMFVLTLACAAVYATASTNWTGSAGVGYSGSDRAQDYRCSAKLDFSVLNMVSNDTVEVLLINARSYISAVEVYVTTTNTSTGSRTVNVGDRGSATQFATGVSGATVASTMSAYTTAKGYTVTNAVVVTALDTLTNGVMYIQFHAESFAH